MKYQIADEPSRLPTAGVEKNGLQDKFPVMVLTGTESQDQKKYDQQIQVEKKKSPPTNAFEYEKELPTQSESIIAQPKGVFCEQYRKLVGLPGS